MTKRVVESLIYLCPCRDGSVALPSGVNFRQTSFQRRDANLIIEKAGGGRVFVRNFFSQSTLPTLRTEDGDEMSGSLAAAFVTLSERTVSALMACGE